MLAVVCEALAVPPGEETLFLEGQPMKEGRHNEEVEEERDRAAPLGTARLAVRT